MTRHVKTGEAKTHLSALLSEVEAGEDVVICRGQTPIARFTRIDHARDHAALQATWRLPSPKTVRWRASTAGSMRRPLPKAWCCSHSH